jgi:2,3,4,5-tetrahydropyridine-2-carboxylate N-succinyltransferase
MSDLQAIIESAFEQRANITPNNVDAKIKSAVLSVIDMLDSGQARIAEKQGNQWVVNQWLKKAVLLYFAVSNNEKIEAGFTQFYDKVPLKYTQFGTEDFNQQKVRVVPHALVRKGAYVAANSVLMPSYINIGAYVDSGSMIDTWATVGSCAQIGKNVHVSGGAGIGGVLEPLQANPVIIEDNAFIGARAEIAEGVIVEEGAVISMGVYLGQSTRIYHRDTGEITYGRVPAYSVVVPGNLPSKDGKYSLYCAVIVKQVDAKTRAKVSINELLREA